MRISDAKILLTSVFAYNLEMMEKGKSFNSYVVPCFLGDPGVGKSTLARQCGTDLDVWYGTTVLAQFDPAELGGFGIPKEVVWERDGQPMMDDNGQPIMVDRVVKSRPDHLPEHTVGIWNLDEFAQALPAQQNIGSELINEWRVGKHAISRGITICATSNKPENKAGTHAMPTHVIDRFTLITIDPDHKEFMEYAQKRHIDPMIRAYLTQNPGDLHKFEPGSKACPTPRSWEKMSAFMSMGLPMNVLTEAAQGTIGEGYAPKFMGWMKVHEKLPKLEDIIKRPKEVPVFSNKEADILYLLLANLADVADESNIESILEYIRRLPNQEFAAFWGKDVFNQRPELLKNKHVTKWKMTDGAKLFSGDV